MRPASKRSGARVLPILLVVILALGAATLFGCATPQGSKEEGVKETVVTLVTNQGEIVLHFFPDVAPEHVKNFVHHSQSGLYAGCTFHRVIPGFMIQGGDPNSKDEDPTNDGMGGYSYQGEGTTLAAEFNDRPHLRGTLSMARAQDPNSAGSQFFICHAAAPFLDGKYTVFGEVVAGLDAVDKIVNADRDGNDRPHENQTITEVLVEEWTTAKVEEMLAAQNP